MPSPSNIFVILIFQPWQRKIVTLKHRLSITPVCRNIIRKFIARNIGKYWFHSISYCGLQGIDVTWWLGDYTKQVCEHWRDVCLYFVKIIVDTKRFVKKVRTVVICESCIFSTFYSCIESTISVCKFYYEKTH